MWLSHDILQVTATESCPRLVTASEPYTLHMGVDEQLEINGMNFIVVLTSVTIIAGNFRRV